MKLLSLIALFAEYVATAIAMITADPSTASSAPTVTVPPTTLNSGAVDYCENVGEHCCTDNGNKLMTCSQYQKWTGFVCPYGCDTDAAMKQCLGLPLAVTAVLQPIGSCPMFGKHRCINHTKVEKCSGGQEWVFLRDCPLGCDKGDDVTPCGSIDSSTFSSKVPTTLIITPSITPDVLNRRSNDGPCTPWTRACGSERRFLFTCGEDGHWDEVRQCNRTNGCKAQGDNGLTCAGHPHFYYDDDRVCERERSCEIMAYKYCRAMS
ncbi:hypothetical protein NX059_003040 [Plenodomus lindquistii]|nr:hypothetical protein NX059_003040 [Plenodomus lindquistii]